MKILYLTNRYSQQRQREKPAWVYPVHLAMEATYDRDQGNEVWWTAECMEGSWPKERNRYYDEVVTKPGRHDFLSLPIPDRKWTMAFDKRYQLYGNYKYHPATHMMAAAGCWHGKCTFCVERNNTYQVRPVHHVMQEIEACEAQGFKEIFDDSATFPVGSWLDRFCYEKAKHFPKVIMGCNMRIGAGLNLSHFVYMKKAGFRMVLFGVESANQSTLDRIGKGIYAKDIIPTIAAAYRAGLEPHIAVMFGQPGEGEEEENRTIDLVHYLLRKGYAKTAQASTYSCESTAPEMVSPNVHRIYNIAWHPEFWINKIRDLRSWEDVKYLLKGIRKGIVHD